MGIRRRSQPQTLAGVAARGERRARKKGQPSRAGIHGKAAYCVVRRVRGKNKFVVWCNHNAGCGYESNTISAGIAAAAASISPRGKLSHQQKRAVSLNGITRYAVRTAKRIIVSDKESFL